MSVKKDKAEKKRLYALGWYEDDDYNWRCVSCKNLKESVECNCELCKGSCEWCKSG